MQEHGGHYTKWNGQGRKDKYYMTPYEESKIDRKPGGHGVTESDKTEQLN